MSTQHVTELHLGSKMQDQEHSMLSHSGASSVFEHSPASKIKDTQLVELSTPCTFMRRQSNA
jgi:hypothetical protein